MPEEGEVWVRGPEVIDAYESPLEANRESFRDGWFRTGDRGFLDERGFLHLTGRIKDTINRGGVRISRGLRSLSDLIAPARPQAVLFYVDTGPGSRTLFEALKKKYGLNLVGVPYCGLAPAMADLLEGRVALAMLDGAAAAAQVATGKVTVLGRADAVVSRNASKAPSLVEQGATGLWVDTRFALMAPASAPPAIVEQLRKLVTASRKRSSVLAQMERLSRHPLDMEPELFARSVAESVDHY